MSTVPSLTMPPFLEPLRPHLQQHTQQLVPILPGTTLDPRLVCCGAFIATNMVIREGHFHGIYLFPNFQDILADIETTLIPSPDRLLILTAGILEHVSRLAQTTPIPKTTKPANPVTWNAGRYHDPVPQIMHSLTIVSTYLPTTHEFSITAHVASHLLDRATTLQWTKFTAIQSFLYLAMTALQTIADPHPKWEQRHHLIQNAVGRNPLRTGSYLACVALRLESFCERENPALHR